MSTILAIDPGNEQSAYALVDAATRRPVEHAKLDNRELRERLWSTPFMTRVDVAAVEMVASYGMPVGREIFDTCVWVGRFAAAIETHTPAIELVYRRDVKLHHCHSSKAKDSNVIQALIDRFASGVRNRGKGTKAEPGWFHGFAGDVWQAYAIGVLVADRIAGEPV